MNANLAEENLRTIRLLMERSAVYRRALAPIMLAAGAFGVAAAALGLCFQLDRPSDFAALWLSTACVAVTMSFLLVRRQALKDSEPFWSPPTFRVGQALLPPLLSGLCLGGALGLTDFNWEVDFPMALVWFLFYGCALHSAGFFMARGIKWLGWLFIVASIALILSKITLGWTVAPSTANWLMGAAFGGLHLAYGVYLYFTEKNSPAA
jgi:hypothetical protein